MALLIILLVLVALLVAVVTFCQIEGYEEPGDELSTVHLEGVYDKLRPTHYATELPTEVYKNSIAELAGETFHSEDAVKDAATLLVTKLNKEIPSGDKHRFQLMSTDIIDEENLGEASATVVQFIVHRPTKAYGLSVIIVFVEASKDIRILEAILTELVFEDKIEAVKGWDRWGEDASQEL